MKKNGIVVASGIHIILWIIILLASVVGRLTYRGEPEMEPLDFALSKGVYNVFVIVAICGLFTAILLFLSLYAIKRHQGSEHKRTRLVTLCFSVIATVLFYVSTVSIFAIRSDYVLIVPILWILCELTCGVLLLIPKR